jgi:hypothetical protein
VVLKSDLRQSQRKVQAPNPATPFGRARQSKLNPNRRSGAAQSVPLGAGEKKTPPPAPPRYSRSNPRPNETAKSPREGAPTFSNPRGPLATTPTPGTGPKIYQLHLRMAGCRITPVLVFWT